MRKRQSQFLAGWILLLYGVLPSWAVACSQTEYAPDIGRGSPLMDAVIQKAYPKVGVLLEKGADPNEVSISDHLTTPLRVAAYINSVPMIRILAARGAKVGPQESSVLLQQIFALKAEPWQKIELMNALRPLGLSLTAKVWDQTGLVQAVGGQPFEVVDVFLAEGVDVNAGKPLCQAVYADRTKIFDKLISAGADDKIVCEGLPFLHRAVQSGNTYAASVLIKRGHDVNEVALVSPLFYSPNVAMARLLLANGADPKLRGTAGQTPVHGASYMMKADLLRFYASLGLDVDAPDDKGDTPLHIAAGQRLGRGNSCIPRSTDADYQRSVRELLLDPIDVLVAAGARVDARNKAGKTPLDLAGQNEIAAHLRQIAGAR